MSKSESFCLAYISFLLIFWSQNPRINSLTNQRQTKHTIYIHASNPLIRPHFHNKIPQFSRRFFFFSTFNIAGVICLMTIWCVCLLHGMMTMLVWAISLPCFSFEMQNLCLSPLHCGGLVGATIDFSSNLVVCQSLFAALVFVKGKHIKSKLTYQQQRSVILLRLSTQ